MITRATEIKTTKDPAVILVPVVPCLALSCCARPIIGDSTAQPLRPLENYVTAGRKLRMLSRGSVDQREIDVRELLRGWQAALLRNAVRSARASRQTEMRQANT